MQKIIHLCDAILYKYIHNDVLQQRGPLLEGKLKKFKQMSMLTPYVMNNIQFTNLRK